MLAKAKAAGKRAILWDEALELNELELAPETIIQAWRSRSHAGTARRRGVGALVSHGFYLDHFEDWEQIWKVRECGRPFRPRPTDSDSWRLC